MRFINIRLQVDKTYNLYHSQIHGLPPESLAQGVPV